MRPKMGAFSVAAVAAVAALVVACGPTAAPSPTQADKPAAKEQADKPAPAPPGSITIGSNPSGTVFYSVSGGLAKVMSDTGLAAVVQPYTGTSTFLPLINTGELDMGVVNAVDMAMAYRGPDKLKVGGRNPFQPTPNARLIMRGAPLYLVEWVKKDSDLKTVADLKGRKVTGEYSAHLAVWFNQFGVLASCGLTWNDVQVVPVPAVNEGLDALIQGRAEAAPHALDSAKVKEADASIGVRGLPICADDASKQRLQEAVPGYYPVQLKGGQSTGIATDTWAIGYDIYMIAGKHMSDDTVYQTTKVLWEQVDKLAPIHPTLKEWTTDRWVHAEVTIPYHPGAIKFFKERGVWKAEMDELQTKLLQDASS
jgi:uncharacterized protein